VEKGPDAFRTISEVADDLDLPQHVLRFWETRFGQIKPMKRGGGRRYYRPDDVDLLRGIRHLLYSEGYTIRGVQQILKDQGLRYVQTIGRSAVPEPQRLRDVEIAGTVEDELPARESVNASGRGGVVSFAPPVRTRSEPPAELPRRLEVPAVPPVEEDVPAIPFRKFSPMPEREEPRIGVRPAIDERLPREPRAIEPRISEPRIAEPRAAEPRPAEPPLRATPRDYAPPEPPRAPSERLSSEAVRLLKATLYELGECKKMLEASRSGGEKF
jgi:DNA-binding transcriptional MerR regulator